MAHVRLAIITRNEAKALPALARGVDGLIDSWCVVDNGPSTDGTPELAQELFGHLPGQVHQSRLAEFDFSSARNEMLDIASEPGVYLLLVDPDSPPVGRFDKTALTAPLYSAAVHDPFGCEWQMPLLMQSDLGARYVGRAHEYLASTEPATELDGVYFDRTGAGCTPARAEWYVKVLTEDLKENADPRAAFYLANTYRDMGKKPEALAMYVRRGAMVGYVEETFWSIYQAGVLLEETDPKTAGRCYLDALAYRPTRAEPLHALARMYNGLGEHHAALAFAEKGLLLAPSPDMLFVERWVERWGMAFEAAAARWWVGDKDEAYGTWERLVASGLMTSDYTDLARRNLALRD